MVCDLLLGVYCPKNGTLSCDCFIIAGSMPTIQINPPCDGVLKRKAEAKEKRAMIKKWTGFANSEEAFSDGNLITGTAAARLVLAALER